MTDEKGFSLFETIITLFIAALLTSASIPTFTGIYRQLHFELVCSDFVHALALARSEAVKRNVRVTISNGTDRWEEGWKIFVDSNNNAAPDPDETILQLSESNKRWLTIRGNGSTQTFISYIPSGRTALLNNGLQMGTLTICSTPPLKKGYSLIINRGGRIRQEEVSYDLTCTH